MSRPTRAGIVHAVAFCDACGWSTESHKNALANGAKHHDRTGHTVRCEQSMVVVYGDGGSERAARRIDHATGQETLA